MDSSDVLLYTVCVCVFTSPDVMSFTTCVQKLRNTNGDRSLNQFYYVLGVLAKKRKIIEKENQVNKVDLDPNIFYNTAHMCFAQDYTSRCLQNVVMRNTKQSNDLQACSSSTRTPAQSLG